MKEKKNYSNDQLDRMEEELLDTLDLIHGNLDWEADPISEEEQAALLEEEQDESYEARRQVRRDRLRKRKLRSLILRLATGAAVFTVSLMVARNVTSAATPAGEESKSAVTAAEGVGAESVGEEALVTEETEAGNVAVSTESETETADAGNIGPQYALPEGTEVPDTATLRSLGVSDTLIDLLNRNPETAGFVMGYLDTDRVQLEPDQIDISQEVTEGEIPLFIQWDRRWGYLQYGDDYFALNGCGPTCLSMVYTGLTGNTDRNPAQVGVWAESKNYYVNGAGTAWEMMETGCEELGLKATVVGMDAGIFRARLEEGMPIIASVFEGDFTDGGHYIVLTGIDENDMVTVNDPNSPANSAVKWDINSLMDQMNTAWAYEVM